ncbi:MAG TPA: N-acetylmuramoyl-L-alanine amidase [Chthonomonadaceae bacterium]|nr:N-acetylmuramoyl-L-alanine amidase [Chthonomonadaceae bacterium]
MDLMHHASPSQAACRDASGPDGAIGAPLRRARPGGRSVWAAVAAVAATAALAVTGLYARSLAQQAPPAPIPLPYAFVQSPNCDDRPPGATVSCIVIHATVEPTTEGTEKIFLTPSRAVSAHFVVGRDGRVVQMVPIEKRAWHAGASVLDGVGKVNDFSVGIEMVNLNDGVDPYSEEQMQAVAGIIRLVRSRYDVPDARIVSHAQIAIPAGRKSDPAGFDFDKLKAMARAVPVPPPAQAAPDAAVAK